MRRRVPFYLISNNNFTPTSLTLSGARLRIYLNHSRGSHSLGIAFACMLKMQSKRIYSIFRQTLLHKHQLKEKIKVNSN